jgi:Domain of unknown function (DUF4394)
MRTLTLFLAVVLLVLAAASPARAATFIALGDDADTFQGIFEFDSGSPGAPKPLIPITGVQYGETIYGIDFRPANGQLYGVGSSNRLYTINPATGAATLVGPISVTLSGLNFGVDFDPVLDRLRVVSDYDQNLVIDPATGMASAGLPLMYAGGSPDPSVEAAAYTNSAPGATSTTLFGIDSGSSDLVVIDPMTGIVTKRGYLGSAPGSRNGFDIVDGTGYLAAFSAFLRVDLSTGNAPVMGKFPDGLLVRGLAAVPAGGGGGGAGESPPPGGAPGDFDLNGDVDLNDLTKLLSALGGEGVTIRVKTPEGVVEGDSMTLRAELLANIARRSRAAQRRRQTVIAGRKITLRGDQSKRVRVPLTRAGRRLYRRYTRKRLRATLRLKVTYRPASGAAAQKRTFKRKVNLRVKRRRR